MSLYLVPTESFGVAPTARPSRCAFQHQRQRADSLNSLFFGTQSDAFGDVVSHLRAQAQAQARRQHERELQRRLVALQQHHEREQRAAALRRASVIAEYEAAAAKAYFAALVEQRQLEAQRQRQRALAKEDEAKQAHARRIKQQQQQAAYEAKLRQSLDARVKKQRQKELELKRKQKQQQQDEEISLEDVIEDLFGGFVQFFGAREQPRQASQEKQQSKPADKEKARETHQHLPSVPEQSEAIDVDMADAPTPAPAAESAPATEVKSAEAPETEHLLFTHPVPAPKDFDISSINLTVDISTNQVRISGLWPSSPTSAAPARSVSPTLSSHSRSSSTHGRGRSPRRSRVADVDENGEEIIPREPSDEDDFVDLGSTNTTTASPAAVVAPKEERSITLDLPKDAQVDSLRADLTDAGLEIYVKRAPQQDIELD